MGGSGMGCASRNVCTCDAMPCRAMPCPCHARQQRFYVLLRIAPISLWKISFFFSFVVVQQRKLLSERYS